MPPPQATYLARTSNKGYDPATLSDDEDDSTVTDTASVSSSTRSSAAAVTTLAVLDGPIPVTENATELVDWKISRVGGEPVRPTAAPAGALPATMLHARTSTGVSLLHSAVVIAGQHGITGLTTPLFHILFLSASPLPAFATTNFEFTAVLEQSFPLTTAPPVESRLCLTCSMPMPLVIQLYCPLLHSSLERVVYVFACPRIACQKKREPRSPGEGPGCVRAWRANGWWREGEEAKFREREERQEREREEKERAQRKEAANQIHLGGLVFGGGGGHTPGPGLVPAAGAPFNPFATAAATPAGGAAFNPFAVPSAPVAAVSSNPFALPGSSTTTTTTTATNSSTGSNPFAALPATASAPAPAAVSGPDPSENDAAAAHSGSADGDSSVNQITSIWPPVASTSASTTTPVFRPQYVATLYEPSSSSAQVSKGKGQRREDELARAFEAELAIRNGGVNAESGRVGGQSKKALAAAAAANDDEADYLDDVEAAARPGKGSGGRVKKGAERASASKKSSAGGGGGGDWAAGEGYEVQRVKGVDDIFLRFQERVSREGRQIVR